MFRWMVEICGKKSSTRFASRENPHLTRGRRFSAHRKPNAFTKLRTPQATRIDTRGLAADGDVG
jgi:hypothetical protein